LTGATTRRCPRMQRHRRCRCVANTGAERPGSGNPKLTLRLTGGKNPGRAKSAARQSTRALRPAVGPSRQARFGTARGDGLRRQRRPMLAEHPRLRGVDRDGGPVAQRESRPATSAPRSCPPCSRVSARTGVRQLESAPPPCGSAPPGYAPHPSRGPQVMGTDCGRSAPPQPATLDVELTARPAPDRKTGSSDPDDARRARPAASATVFAAAAPSDRGGSPHA